MKKTILALLILAICPLFARADYGMIKLPEQSVQNNLVIPELKTYTPPVPASQSIVTYPIKTAVAAPTSMQAPSLPTPNAVMARLTGSFDDAFSQIVNILSQKDFQIVSYDVQKGFIIAQNTLNGEKIFSVLGTYDNQCFVKISCLTSSCSSIDKFSGM